MRLKAGGHFGAFYCQTAIKLISCNALQISTYRPLDFSHCYKLGDFNTFHQFAIIMANYAHFQYVVKYTISPHTKYKPNKTYNVMLFVLTL